MAKMTFSYGWSWAEAFMFGSIMSATDPVAVVALLKDLGASKQLGTLMEGESLLNDGTPQPQPPPRPQLCTATAAPTRPSPTSVAKKTASPQGTVYSRLTCESVLAMVYPAAAIIVIVFPGMCRDGHCPVHAVSRDRQGRKLHRH